MPSKLTLKPIETLVEPNTEPGVNLAFRDEANNMVCLALDKKMASEAAAMLIQLAMLAPSGHPIKEYLQLIAIRDIRASFSSGMITLTYENEAGVEVVTSLDYADAVRLRDELTQCIDIAPAPLPNH